MRVQKKKRCTGLGRYVGEGGMNPTIIDYLYPTVSIEDRWLSPGPSPGTYPRQLV